MGGLAVRKKGLFITFEGIEGSGKSSQMDLLAQFLSQKGYGVVVTKEPGGSVIGDKIRKILLNPDLKEMTAKTEMLLYAANRAQHVSEVIKPALKENKIVLSDRYYDSSLAYQGFGRGLDLKKITELNEWVIDGVTPDLTILLDLPPEKGLKRIVTSLADRLEQESIDFHTKVSKGYHRLAKMFPKRYRIVDASRDVQEIHSEIVKIVEEIL